MVLMKEHITYNKEGTQPCRGVDFLFQKLLRPRLRPETPNSTTILCTQSALKDTRFEMPTTGFSARIFQLQTQSAG